jgi:hypothetical protein
MSKQLPKEGSAKDNGTRITKAMEQLKKLNNLSGSQKASSTTGHRSSLIQGLRNIIEPLATLRKGKIAFNKMQKLACAPEQLDDDTPEKPGAAYLDLEKPPETGAAVCAPDATPTPEGRRAQAEAIGSHNRRHPPENPSHEMTTQVDYDCDLWRDNQEAVRCDSASENHKGKHSPRMESCATSPLGTTNYKDSGQSNNAIPGILRKECMGGTIDKSNWWPTIQEQSEKQAQQRMICQDRKQHVVATIARAGRAKQCLSASPSSSTPLENYPGIVTSTSAFADTIAAPPTNSNHLDKPESPQLLLGAKTLRFQGTGLDAIDELPMDGRGPASHHYTRKETLLPNKETIKAPEVAAEQACSLIYNDLKSLTSRELPFKISIQWECKNKCRCKDTLQVALKICIPHKEHLGPIDTPPCSRKITWDNLTKVLQRCLKGKPSQQNNHAMALTRAKWCQRMYQRLPDKEQAYSLRQQGCRSEQMDMLEWLVEGRNIGVNPAKIAGMTTWSWEPRGIRRMQDTSGAPKHQGSFIQGFGHGTESHTGITKKGKSHKWT